MPQGIYFVSLVPSILGMLPDWSLLPPCKLLASSRCPHLRLGLDNLQEIHKAQSFSPVFYEEPTPPQALRILRPTFRKTLQRRTTTMATPAPKMTRFDLPGLNLPLNWVPEPKLTTCEQDGKGYIHQVDLPRAEQGDRANLFPVALNDSDLEGGCTR